MTDQEIFDTAARHILSTGKPSLDPTGRCLYGGSGCAMRPFLKGESFPRIEGKDIRMVAEQHPEYLTFKPSSTQISLMRGIQRAHDDLGDDPGFIRLWKGRMIEIARICRLDAKLVQ